MKILVEKCGLNLQPALLEKNKFTDKERLTEKLETKLLERSIVFTRGNIAYVNYIKVAKAKVTAEKEEIIEKLLGEIIKAAQDK